MQDIRLCERRLREKQNCAYNHHKYSMTFITLAAKLRDKLSEIQLNEMLSEGSRHIGGLSFTLHVKIHFITSN